MDIYIDKTADNYVFFQIIFARIFSRELGILVLVGGRLTRDSREEILGMNDLASGARLKCVTPRINGSLTTHNFFS